MLARSKNYVNLKKRSCNEEKTKIGILCLEAGKVPKGLLQLEALIGNSRNPKTYSFPIEFTQIEGACTESIINNPSKKVLKTMIKRINILADKGVMAVSTSCGFNGIFQKELADSCKIPVFTSALLQIPYIKNIIGSNKKIVVITANKGALKEEHFIACGLGSMDNVRIVGLEDLPEWAKIFADEDVTVDLEVIEKGLIKKAITAKTENEDVGAVLLECTDLPPFREKIGEVTNLPVFDFVTMIAQISVALGLTNIEEQVSL